MGDVLAMIPTISQHLLELGSVGRSRTFARINKNLDYRYTSRLAVLSNFPLLNRQAIVL